MRRASRVSAILAILAAAVGAGWWLTRPEPPAVSAVVARRATFTDTVPGTATGVVEPARRIQVQAQLSSRIVEVKVRRGDLVKAGDPLVELDASDIRDQVRAIQSTLPVLEARISQASARAEQVALDADRAERLARDGSLPQAQRDTAVSGRRLAMLDVVATRAALQQARVQLDVARSALRHAVVRAPFDGRVLDVDAEVGQMTSVLSLGATGGGGSAPRAGGLGGIQASSAALLAGAGGGGSGLVDLADEATMAVEVDLDERDFGRVRVGQEAMLSVDALGKKVFTGTVEEVFPFISRALDQNRTARIRVRLPDEARSEVRPGMSVQVEVLVARRDNALVVPTTTVMTRAGGKVVWRVADGRIRETPIVVAASTWEWTVVESGLSEGDVLVVPRGGAGLRDGQKVRVEEAPAS